MEIKDATHEELSLEHENVMTVVGQSSKDFLVKINVLESPEVLMDERSMYFWEFVEGLEKWGMTENFQDFIKGILRDIYYLHEKAKAGEISVENIVVAETDQYYKIPKIFCSTHYAGNCSLLEMLKGLEVMIRKTMNKQEISIESVTYDVNRFLLSLSDPFLRDVDFLKDHPALKKKGERLKYIGVVMDGFSTKRFGGLKEAEKKKKMVFGNWLMVVEKSEHLNAILNPEKSSYRNELTGLINFIGIANKHLKVNVNLCLDQEAAVPSTHFQNVDFSPLPKGKTDLEIELIFEMLFPALASHLYEHTVLLP